MSLISILSLALLGLGLGIGLGIAAKKFAVVRNERELMAIEALPGANCGACGFPGCQAFAASVVKGECPVTGCPAGGSAVHSRLAEILGVEHKIAEPMVAVVRCRGSKFVSKERFEYEGVKRCSAAALLSGGGKACVYGCLGLGDCANACPFGAIEMGSDGLPHVNEAKCTACGVCVKACPKGIIALIPENQEVYVACVSPEKGKTVKECCSAGCIGCGICVKFSPEGAVELKNNLPEIKPMSSHDLEKAIDKCPVKVLIRRT